MNETLNDSIPTPEATYTVPIESLDHFVKILASWHSEKVKVCKQLLAVPENAVFQVGEEELVLSDKTFAGFKFGVEMALIQLGELPFVVEFEDVPAEAVPG